MPNKTFNLGLHSGPPRSYKTEAQVREQLRQGPTLLGPSIATLMVQRSKATKAEKPSEKKPTS